jgi:phosphatidylglycerophosphate synthase
MSSELEDPDRVHRYVFTSEDRSLVQARFDRWINLPLVARAPRAWNPNVFTFAGHAAAIAAFALLARADLAAPAELRLRALAAAALLFFYCVMDSVDGLHARRLGVSNPLGDFYDHGLDAIAGFTIPLGGLAAYGATARERLVAVSAFAVGWWANNLDRRRTRRLVLPPFGAMEGNFLTILVHLAAALAGPRLFHARVAGIGAADALTAVAVLGFAAVAIEALYKVGPERRHALGIATNVTLIAAWFGHASALGLACASSLLVPVLVGLVAVKHNWDVLRNILLGTRFRSWDRGVTAALALWNASLFVPALRGDGAQRAATWALLALVIAKLAHLLAHTTAFTRRALGLGLLGLSPGQRGQR